jgi:hypothetical protein
MYAIVVAVLALAGCTGTPAPAPTVSPVPVPTALPTTPSATADPTVAALLARPLRLPRLATGARCPRTPAVAHSPVVQPADTMGLGRAPLYPISFYAGSGGLSMPTDPPGPDGLYDIKVVWASIGGHAGPAVVRAGRVDGPGRALVRLYYDPAASRGDAVVFPLLDGPGDYPSGTFVSGPGCYVWQIDGTGFSETVYFEVTP